jgi:hypothetical protein
LYVLGATFPIVNVIVETTGLDPGTFTLEGLIDTPLGAPLSDKLTVPVKLLYGVMVSVRLVDLLGRDVMDVGTRLMVK